jgi:hypothetical protein
LAQRNHPFFFDLAALIDEVLRGDGEDLAEGSSLSIPLPATTPVKKRTQIYKCRSVKRTYPSEGKRAETRPCPVCNDAIPIRLLPAHSELELERVKDIMNGIGSTEVIMHEFDNGYVLHLCSRKVYS